MFNLRNTFYPYIVSVNSDREYNEVFSSLKRNCSLEMSGTARGDVTGNAGITRRYPEFVI